MSSRIAHGSRRCRSTTLRRFRPRIDHLESRALLSTTVTHPTFVLEPFAGGSGPGGGFTPAQLQTAYGFSSINFNGTAGTGKGETIAIVDAFDDPNIQSDLNTFDSNFGLPATTVSRVNETGGTSFPRSDPTGGWELEESLDVEWAHAMAPQANILLVEASSTSNTDLLDAVKYASAHANVVSMSWGGGEFSGETADDSTYFDQAGVVFVASSGDSGAPAIWPAVSPNVLSVGGTALTVGAGNVWSSEVGWSGSSGGPSAFESQPSYQTGVVTQTSSARATPDVAYDASPSTGVAVYDSVPYHGDTLGWVVVGGTSAGAPQWSALVAIADQGRALSGQEALNSTSPTQVMSVLYENPTDFHDITSGTSTGSPQYSAGTGYDYVTGMGTPIANLVVGSLVGTPQVNLSSAFNRTGIVADGTKFSGGGLDGNGYALSSSQVGTTLTAGGATFDLGPVGANDVVSTAGQTIALPAGQDVSLDLLATAVNGNQPNLTFTVKYTDGTTATFTQSVSDWFTPQNYSGESEAVTMAYRDRSNGTKDNRTFFLYGYTFALNSAKTVSSLTLPNDANVELVAATLRSATMVNLSGAFNQTGIYADGSTFSGTGGLGGGTALSANLLGTSQTWMGTTFAIGPAGSSDVVSATGQTIALPAGQDVSLDLLATGVNGNQPNQTFTVKYSDGTTATFTQSLSDWFTARRTTRTGQSRRPSQWRTAISRMGRKTIRPSSSTATRLPSIPPRRSAASPCPRTPTSRCWRSMCRRDRPQRRTARRSGRRIGRPDPPVIPDVVSGLRPDCSKNTL